MKKILVLILIVIAILKGCTEEKNKNSSLFNGLWFSEADGKVWVVNDSLILFYPFYPYSEWKISNDTLRVLDLAGYNSGVVNWFEYTFDELNDQEAYVRFTEESSDILKFLRITQLEKSDYLLDKLSLLISDCEYEEDCLILEIEINLSDSTVSVLDVNKSDQAITCMLNPQDLLAIRFLTDRVDWNGINKPMISNVMDSKYFNLSVDFVDQSQNKKVLSDTGGFAPASIDYLITFIWATSQLRCFPEDYRRDLFSY
jgi:hypothetical protein